jgi:hypothetical protein
MVSKHVIFPVFTAISRISGLYVKPGKAAVTSRNTRRKRRSLCGIADGIDRQLAMIH